MINQTDRTSTYSPSAATHDCWQSGSLYSLTNGSGWGVIGPGDLKVSKWPEMTYDKLGLAKFLSWLIWGNFRGGAKLPKPSRPWVPGYLCLVPWAPEGNRRKLITCMHCKKNSYVVISHSKPCLKTKIMSFLSNKMSTAHLFHSTCLDTEKIRVLHIIAKIPSSCGSHGNM